MITRKEMKKAAKRNVKKHYGMFVAVCLLSMFIGGEFFNTSGTGQVSQPENTMEQEAEEPDSSGGVLIRRQGALDVLNEILMGNDQGGKELAQKIMDEKMEDAQNGSPVLGRTRGVLAKAVNSVSSGSIFVTAALAVKAVTGSNNFAVQILVVLSFLLAFAFWVFLQNVYTVVTKRIFLEGRCYDGLPVQRILFLIRVKKWAKVTWAMLLTFIYQFLWSLTVIGGFIKPFSYYLVPYILAENPDIPARKAITLSRKMMKGHKWECFIFNLSFFWWDILSWLTLGAVSVLYVKPYKEAAFAEYFTQLRQSAKEQKLEDADLLDDRYLYDHPEAEVLAWAYADVIEVMVRPAEEMKELKGALGFFARHLGILLTNNAKEREYEEYQEAQIRIRALRKAAEGKCYPDRLFTIPEEEKHKKVETIHYLRNYSIWSLAMMFIIFSFIGWVWEVSLNLIEYGMFVNRGVLHGPWLPIYGFGGVLILVVLNKMRRNPAVLFASVVVLCGTIEYFTAYYLEIAEGKKWWDYTGYFLNLHGRICAEGLFVFGIGGMVIVYLFAPLLDNHIKKIRLRILIPVCLLLLSIYLGDAVYSSGRPNTGEGITDYQNMAELPKDNNPKQLSA